MTGSSLLVDTNIVLYLLSGDETVADLLDEKHIYLSFVTELELLSYNRLTDRDRAKINALLNECTIVDVNQTIKSNTIQLRSRHSLKLPDCIIIATAQYLGLPLISADAQFGVVESIDLISYQP